METLMQVGQGRFTLQRFPLQKNDPLRAWDAADEYLLAYLAGQSLNKQASVTILNDGFGALSVALNELNPDVISDSWLSHQGILNNLQNNHIPASQLNLLTSLQKPSRPIDWLLIKIPKTLALLEHQLIELAPLLTPQTRVVAASMIKNMPRTVWTLFERLLGDTTTSLAKKKARLIHVQVSSDRKIPANPYPTQYRLENTDYIISNHANVFSRDHLDIGTRFLLAHLPQSPGQEVIDLGCGNGVVGVMMAAQHKNINVRFLDESFMAIASARDNFERAFSGHRAAEFITTDCLAGIDDNSADCIICNPPFHQQQVVGVHIARRMFVQSKKVLKTGGEIRVIGNRHLDYHVILKQIFGNCQLIASNRKFVVLQAVR